MRQAILTKYLGPTNTLGSRIKATSAARSITVQWSPELDVYENHLLAAEKLLNLMEWDIRNTLFGGSLPDSTGYCFVQVPYKRN